MSRSNKVFLGNLYPEFQLDEIMERGASGVPSHFMIPINYIRMVEWTVEQAQFVSLLDDEETTEWNEEYYDQDCIYDIVLNVSISLVEGGDVNGILVDQVPIHPNNSGVSDFDSVTDMLQYYLIPLIAIEYSNFDSVFNLQDVVGCIFLNKDLEGGPSTPRFIDDDFDDDSDGIDVDYDPDDFDDESDRNISDYKYIY